MEYQIRKYPEFSACGLNCGLCPRYHTDGTSKCPGCAGENFLAKHPSCGILSCSHRKGFEYCFLCEEYPCKKYKGADLSDSFITHKNQFCDFEKAKQFGLKAYEVELNKKMKILKQLLDNYDDGRRKSFFCVAVNLLDIQDINSVMKQLAKETKSEANKKIKAKVAVSLFEKIAEQKDVSLKLRKREQ